MAQLNFLSPMTDVAPEAIARGILDGIKNRGDQGAAVCAAMLTILRDEDRHARIQAAPGRNLREKMVNAGVCDGEWNLTHMPTRRDQAAKRERASAQATAEIRSNAARKAWETRRRNAAARQAAAA